MISIIVIILINIRIFIPFDSFASKVITNEGGYKSSIRGLFALSVRKKNWVIIGFYSGITRPFTRMPYIALQKKKNPTAFQGQTSSRCAPRVCFHYSNVCGGPAVTVE